MRNRRYRAYFAASAILIVLVARRGRANSPTSHQNATPQNTSQPSNQNKRRKFWLRYDEPEHSKETSWHAEEREQHRVERAYWGLGAVFAIFGLLLTFVAAVGAVSAAVISNWAYREATRATAEAHDQAVTAHKQLRAYIGVMSAGMFLPEPNTGDDMIGFMLKNFGPTPATKIEITSSSYITNKIHSLNVNDRDKQSRTDKPHTIVYPGDSIKDIVRMTSDPSIKRVFNQEDIDLFTSGKAVIFWYGTVHYWDIFDVEQTTDFCQIFANMPLFPAPSAGSVACTNHRGGS